MTFFQHAWRIAAIATVSAIGFGMGFGTTQSTGSAQIAGSCLLMVVFAVFATFVAYAFEVDPRENPAPHWHGAR